jgi:hypothetical protein
MILPTKHLSGKRALINIGAELLRLLKEPKTVSRLWDEFQMREKQRSQRIPQTMTEFTVPSVTYDWFVLALDALFMFEIIELKRGKITMSKS